MTDKTKEYNKDYAKRYYQENKEYFREKQKEWRTKNKKRWQELCAENRRKRIARLREEGVINPYAVVNKSEQPRYKDN
jgi:polyhydroxyalkanoate synthesis regulator phasin